MNEPTPTSHSRESLAKIEIAKLPAGMSKGQKALESLMIYRSCRAAVPDDVFRCISNCYQHFITGKPGGAYHPDNEINTPAPLTLGEAFGVEDIKGGRKTALKRKALAIKKSILVSLFTGQGRKRLARSRFSKRGGISDAVVAVDHRLTVSEIEDWIQEHLAEPRKK